MIRPSNRLYRPQETLLDTFVMMSVNNRTKYIYVFIHYNAEFLQMISLKKEHIVGTEEHILFSPSAEYILLFSVDISRFLQRIATCFSV